MKNLNKMNDREIDMGVAGTSKSWHHEVTCIFKESNFKRFVFLNQNDFIFLFSTKIQLGFLPEGYPMI